MNGACLAAVLVAMLLVATDMREGFEGLRGSVEMLGQAVRTLSRYRAALARLAPEAEDDSAQFAGAVQLDEVTFTYDGADRPAVRDVSVDLQPGAVVALVGENGSGKSTMLALLLGLRLPDRGTVTAGGVELTAARDRAWRSRCSAAPWRWLMHCPMVLQRCSAPRSAPVICPAASGSGSPRRVA